MHMRLTNSFPCISLQFPSVLYHSHCSQILVFIYISSFRCYSIGCKTKVFCILYLPETRQSRDRTILFLLLPYHFSRAFDKPITYDKMNKNRFALHSLYRDFMEGEICIYRRIVPLSMIILMRRSLIWSLI